MAKILMPHFSVLMANYNKSAYLDEAIASVLAQTFSDWELVIVDDASTDNSLELIQKYIGDPRIRLFARAKNAGYIETLIYGLTQVTSHIVGILDSDDALAPQAIEKAHAVHRDRPEVGLVLSQLIVCDAMLRPLFATTKSHNPPDTPMLWAKGTTAFRSFKMSAYRKTAGFDARMRYAEDRDLVIKLEEVAATYRLDEPLYLHRQLSSSQSHEASKYSIGRCSVALALYSAYFRRRRTPLPKLPRRVLLEWILAAVRYAVELREPLRAMSFAWRGLRIAPLDRASTRGLVVAGKAVIAVSQPPKRGLRVGGGARRETTLMFFPVREFQSNTGDRQPDRIRCIPLVHRFGHCLFGKDYVVTTSGRYLVTFEIGIETYEFAEDPIVVLDVYENLVSESILVARRITVAELTARPRGFNLEFSAREGERVEFRVFWGGQCFLNVGGVLLDRLSCGLP